MCGYGCNSFHKSETNSPEESSDPKTRTNNTFTVKNQFFQIPKFTKLVFLLRGKFYMEIYTNIYRTLLKTMEFPSDLLYSRMQDTVS